MSEMHSGSEPKPLSLSKPDAAEPPSAPHVAAVPAPPAAPVEPVAPVTSGPAPGWYTVSPLMERWWDGTAWGPQTRPLVAAPAQPVAPAPLHGTMVTTAPVRTSHTFHLIMTVLTCGLWLPIWGLIALLNKMSKQKTVTRY